MNGAKSMAAKHFLRADLTGSGCGMALCRTPPLNPVADYRKMPG